MTLRGAVHHFPLETVLLLLAETGKTGRLEVRGDEGHGYLGLQDGRLVSAEFDDERGKTALGAVFTILRGDFEFVPSEHVKGANLEGDLDPLLEAAMAERDRIAQVREVIPHERIRFRLSERAAGQDRIVLTSEQWRALLAADGERDLIGVAEKLGITRLAAEDLLATLVRSGMIDTMEPTPGSDQRPYRRLPPMPPIPPTTAGEPVLLRGTTVDFPLETIVQLLAATKKTGRLEVRSDDGPSTLGLSDGDLLSATSGEEEGELALGSAFTSQDAEFDFIPMPEAAQANLTGDLDKLLDHAAEVRDRLVAVKALIPGPRSRFALSDRATRNPQISLTPEQWRLLMKIDPQRDVWQIAEELHARRLPTMMLIADLIRGGFVDVVPAEAERTWPYVERRRAPWAPPITPTPLVAMPGPPPAAPTAEVAEAAPSAAPEPAVAEAPVAETPPAPSGPETPLAGTPLDREVPTDDRLAALEGLFGRAEPAPPPAAWEPPPTEAPAPSASEAAPEEPAVDPRLAAFETWQTPVLEEPTPTAAIPTVPEAVTEAPAEPATAAELAPSASFEAPAEAPAPKKGGLFGILGGKVTAAPVPPLGRSRSAKLAAFANELVAGYNSGQYGKARVEDRMLSLLMRVDEQADPIDRPLPIANGRIDVASIEGGAVPESQALPYLALLVRQIYDDAERALGKDKAKRGFRDTRDRLFGKDVALFQTPEIVTRLPKV